MSGKGNVERCENRKMHVFRFVIFLMVYIMYVCFGAMVFSLIESPVEEEIRKDIYNARSSFSANATCISGKINRDICIF